MTGCGETIILNECETFYGLVESTQDALLIFEACSLGVLRRVKRRLAEEERKTCVRPGAVFVYDENESGIKRWTDGKEWSPSRILGNFLVYRELEKKISRREGGGPGGSGLPPELCGRELQILGSTKGTFVFKNDGLIKKTISVVVSGSMHHLVCYCMRDIDPNLRLYPPGAYRELTGIPVRQEFVEAQNFRRPLKVVRYRENGMPERRSISTRGSAEEDDVFTPEEVAVTAAGLQFGQTASTTPAGSSSSTSGVTLGSGLDLFEEEFTLTELSSVNECGTLNAQNLQSADIAVNPLDVSTDGTGFSQIRIGAEMGSDPGCRQALIPNMPAWESAQDLTPLLFSLPLLSAGQEAQGHAENQKSRTTVQCAAALDDRGIMQYFENSSGTQEPFSAGVSRLQCPVSSAGVQTAPNNLLAGLNWQDPVPEVVWQTSGDQLNFSRNVLIGQDTAIGRTRFDANGFDTSGFGLNAVPEHSAINSSFGAVDEHDFMPHSTFDNLAPHDAYTALWSVSEG